MYLKEENLSWKCVCLHALDGIDGEGECVEVLGVCGTLQGNGMVESDGIGFGHVLGFLKEKGGVEGTRDEGIYAYAVLTLHVFVD